MIGRIMKQKVDALKPGTLLWDRDLRGFAVRRRGGDVATYLVKYRTRSRRQRWYRIGAHGSPWSPDTARAEALQVLAAVARGEDPAGTRSAARDALTVGALLDRFVSDHVARKRSSTAHEYRRMIAATLRPALGAIPVTAVTPDDVARLHQRLMPTPVLANRAVAILSKAFALAERWQMRATGTNPARGIDKYRETKRTRRLSLEELGRLGAVLSAADAGPIQVPGRTPATTTTVHVSPFVLGAIRLLLFTGARKSEILTATWDMVDRERAVLRLADSKTGAKDVLLTAPALDVLDGLARIEGNPHLLPGARAGQPLVNLSKPLRAILMAAGLSGVSLHVLRHSFASVGVDAGLSLPIVGKLLGHAQPATTQRYAHVADPVRAAGELVAGRIADAMSGGAK
jgi:integrase